jgi:hypothetical protein
MKELQLYRLLSSNHIPDNYKVLICDDNGRLKNVDRISIDTDLKAVLIDTNGKFYQPPKELLAIGKKEADHVYDHQSGPAPVSKAAD